jgi:hypothetical protein
MTVDALNVQRKAYLSLIYDAKMSQRLSSRRERGRATFGFNSSAASGLGPFIGQNFIGIAVEAARYGHDRTMRTTTTIMPMTKTAPKV